MTDGLTNPTTPTLANQGEPGPSVTPAAAPAAPQPATPAAAKPVPGSEAWAKLTPEQRHAQLRGPENPRSRGHSPARDQREAAAARSAGEDPQREAPSGDQQTSPPAGEKIKVGKFEVSEGELAAMMDRQAQDDLRKATVPAAPEA